MRNYTPNFPFTTPMELLNITGKQTVKGVDKVVYADVGNVVFGSFKSFGGTETQRNGVITVENTANIETWYRPDIIASSRLRIDGELYEILGTPEDIDKRHQFLVFKVRSIKGGA